MAAIANNNRSAGLKKSQRGTEESRVMKWALIVCALAFCFIFLLLPLVNVFVQALAKGWSFYLQSLLHPDSCCYPPDPVGGRNQCPAERALWVGGGVGDRQV